ncbi:hypothetical protein M5689_021280 [Euphorbia peplus]|nr:hypothetical protein M5689_021280 [Euphorbia peplus]
MKLKGASLFLFSSFLAFILLLVNSTCAGARTFPDCNNLLKFKGSAIPSNLMMSVQYEYSPTKLRPLLPSPPPPPKQPPPEGQSTYNNEAAPPIIPLISMVTDYSNNKPPTSSTT